MTGTTNIDSFLAGAVRALHRQSEAGWTLTSDALWTDVWTRIEFHGLPLLLHENAEFLIRWPDQLLEQIAEEARLMVLWETTHKHVVTTLLDALSEAQIGTVMMKGTALAYSLHDDPAIRRRGDTDLLIQPRHKQRTRELLADLGWYRKPDPHGLNYQEGWLHDAAGFFSHAVDLHWEPSERAVLQSVLPLDRFFEKRQPLPHFHHAAYRPDWAIMVLHGAINQKWHEVHGYDTQNGRLVGGRRLIWSVDFALLVAAMRDEDWDDLSLHCLQNGVAPLVAEVLRDAAADLAFDLPDARMARLENATLDPDVITYFHELDGLSQFLLDLRKSSSISAKAHLLGSRMFPPRDHLIEKYPAAQKWPTLALQGRMIAETAGRILRKAVTR